MGKRMKDSIGIYVRNFMRLLKKKEQINIHIIDTQREKRRLQVRYSKSSQKIS